MELYRTQHGAHRPVCGGRCLVAHVGANNFSWITFLFIFPAAAGWAIFVSPYYGWLGRCERQPTAAARVSQCLHTGSAQPSRGRGMGSRQRLLAGCAHGTAAAFCLVHKPPRLPRESPSKLSGPHVDGGRVALTPPRARRFPMQRAIPAAARCLANAARTGTLH